MLQMEEITVVIEDVTNNVVATGEVVGAVDAEIDVIDNVVAAAEVIEIVDAEIDVTALSQTVWITSPIPNTTFAGTTVTFTWEAAYSSWLYVGSSLGAYDLHQSGELGGASSREVSGLPLDGRTVYVRLYKKATADSSWRFRDYQYTAYTEPDWITSPVPGSQLLGATVTFTWEAAYSSWLYVGSSLGAYDLHQSGELGGATSRVVSGLPLDGRTIYVRLYKKAGAGSPWIYRDYQYIAAEEEG
jgi:hypothetical protein